MAAYQSGASPLNGIYLVRNPLLRAALTLRDAYLRVAAPSRATDIPRHPKRILLAVGGQLGDAVIATSAIQQLHWVFPDAEISVVCPPASAVVFEGLTTLKRVHRLDHWFWGHRGSGRADVLRRWYALRAARSASVREIAAAGYDVAIDLYPFFPSTAPVFAAAGIAARIGYSSGGAAALLTHAVPWADTRSHVAVQHTTLLARHWPEISSVPERYALPPLSDDIAQAGRALLAMHGVTGPYVVLHPGTSAEKKRWPAERWQQLAVELRNLPEYSDTTIVFTGHGAADEEFIAKIRAGETRTASLCNETNWPTFRWIAEHSALVVTADSVAGHVSGAAGLPTVVIAAGMSDPEHWKPIGAQVEQLTTPVPCAPCFRSNGCETMRCVRGVDLSGVVAAIRRLR